MAEWDGNEWAADGGEDWEEGEGEETGEALEEWDGDEAVGEEEWGGGAEEADDGRAAPKPSSSAAGWQGTGLTSNEFFSQQEKIPVEITPADPSLKPLTNYSAAGQIIHPQLARSIQAAGYTQPTPVQKWGIPLLLKGKDVMACAQTGSGKTAFYLFPAINKLLKSNKTSQQSSPAAPSVLVLGPTRELCVQIHDEAQKFTSGSRVQTGVVYGGTEYRESLRQLSGGVDILVATPGRLQDLCDRNACVLRWIQSLVLDEADRMLDMGFEPQIRKIVQKLGMPKTRQTVMTSATFPPEVQHLAQDFMRDYSFMAVGRVGGTASSIRQKLEWVEDHDKNDFLYGLLVHQPNLGLTLIFVNTKQAAMDLVKFLGDQGMKAESIHGDRTQGQREDALQAFKSHTAPILIATDVAARGLDIPDVALVVQYDLAMGVDDYVHRIGRTGRIGKKGLAVGMVNNRNKGMAADLINAMEGSGSKPPPFLVGMAISNGNYQPGGGGGGNSLYGGQDVRRGKRGFQTLEEREKARRVGNFAQDAYGEGSSAQAAKIARTVGPQNAGAYAHAAPKGKGGKGGKGGGGKGGKGGGARW
eukprot:TRINITY_DN1340_c0_g1_i1.p1 TRINITY_DN1340_c0_g1~~TRINITY_DN1340_c0_g1_i1.p1  ORF type:complete len:585 (+),score=161.33 TRINITY_DN1340_c0_g1_i1:221-1975(+)